MTLMPRLYPLKVGGYTGKTEPSSGMTRAEQKALDRALIKAVHEGDEAKITAIELRIFKTAVPDIKTGYMVFIPGAVRNLVPKNTKTLQYLDDQGTMRKVMVRLDKKGKPMIRDWQTSKKHPSRVVWLEGKPFENLKYQQIANMIDNSVRLFTNYTIKLTPRKHVKGLKEDATKFGKDLGKGFKSIGKELFPKGKR